MKEVYLNISLELNQSDIELLPDWRPKRSVELATNNYPLPNLFIEDTSYEFEFTENKLDLLFLGYSRIDGHPIFSCVLSDSLPNNSIGLYSYQKRAIRDISLVKDLGDHLIKYRYLKQNKDTLIDFLFKHHKIKDEDLLDLEATKSIIREIKLGKMLD